MTAGLEAITALRFVYGRLASDQELATALGTNLEGLDDRVNEGAHPFGTPLPGVRLTIGQPQDVKVVGTTQVWSRVDIDVIVDGEGSSYTPLVDAYERIHTLLESQGAQAVTDGLILTCHRVSGIIYPERANGTEYRHLGGTYRIEAQ